MQLTALLDQLIDGRASAPPIAAARILTGIAALGHLLEEIAVVSRFGDPHVLRLPYVTFSPDPGSSLVSALFVIWAISALAFALGWFTRLMGGLLTLVMSLVLLLDQQTYSNHGYLLILLVLLLTLANSGAGWSIDSRQGRAGNLVPAWPVALLRVQFSIVYLFGALAKVNTEYLSGDVLGNYLRGDGWLTLPHAWLTDPVLVTLSIAAVVVEAFLAIALWLPRLRLRWIGVGSGLALHLGILLVMHETFSLVVFCLTMAPLYLSFFSRLMLESMPQVDRPAAERLIFSRDARA